MKIQCVYIYNFRVLMFQVTIKMGKFSIKIISGGSIRFLDRNTLILSSNSLSSQ